MAKKGLSKELKIILGIALILMALLGIGTIVTILLVILGGYLIYSGLKKDN